MVVTPQLDTHWCCGIQSESWTSRFCLNSKKPSFKIQFTFVAALVNTTVALKHSLSQRGQRGLDAADVRQQRWHDIFKTRRMALKRQIWWTDFDRLEKPSACTTTLEYLHSSSYGNIFFCAHKVNRINDCNMSAIQSNTETFLMG